MPIHCIPYQALIKKQCIYLYLVPQFCCTRTITVKGYSILLFYKYVDTAIKIHCQVLQMFTGHMRMLLNISSNPI